MRSLQSSASSSLSTEAIEGHYAGRDFSDAMAILQNSNPLMNLLVQIVAYPNEQRKGIGPS
ncbi:hypothetical protein SLEP1_g25213 [Rubroshorea leprosula]|uniref:Uncharacterized protein n=1 Tax=Rubroshorea leprosula TaxID=152421 RepID=A0AAV5JI79_9ROSI|nr:hypothetical protein SLEP1_g25213 [Rubroshorea leprosula]